MEECLSAMLCFPVLTPAPDVRKSTQWPTVQEALHPCAESCSVSVQDCRAARSHMMAAARKTRQHASHEDSDSDPGISLLHQLHVLSRKCDTNLMLLDHRQLVVGDFLCLHRILPFHCPEPRAQLLQNLHLCQTLGPTQKPP